MTRVDVRLLPGKWAPGGTAAALAAVITLLAAVSGCSKHEWVARRMQEGRGTPYAAGDTTSASRGRAAGDGSSAARFGASGGAPVAASSEPPPDNPATLGAAPAPAPAEGVSPELPWEAPASAPASAPPAVDCSTAPCFWIQVAALADSSGAAKALAQAKALTRLGGEAPAPPGGGVSRDGQLWKVRVGPWRTWEAGDSALKALRVGGFPKAWLVRQPGFSG